MGEDLAAALSGERSLAGLYRRLDEVGALRSSVVRDVLARAPGSLRSKFARKVHKQVPVRMTPLQRRSAELVIPQQNPPKKAKKVSGPQAPIQRAPDGPHVPLTLHATPDFKPQEFETRYQVDWPAFEWLFWKNYILPYKQVGFSFAVYQGRDPFPKTWGQYGIRNDQGQPFTPLSIGDMDSMGKVITASCLIWLIAQLPDIQQLWADAQGKPILSFEWLLWELSILKYLEAPIAGYLPNRVLVDDAIIQLNPNELPGAQLIRILDLLMHTSGLPKENDATDGHLAYGAFQQLTDWDWPPNGIPAKTDYRNANYTLLKYVIVYFNNIFVERWPDPHSIDGLDPTTLDYVIGQMYAQIVKNMMVRIPDFAAEYGNGFFPDVDVDPIFAPETYWYVNQDATNWYDEASNHYGEGPLRCGAAGWHMTTHQMARFINALETGWMMPKEYWYFMSTNATKIAEAAGFDYGFALFKRSSQYPDLKIPYYAHNGFDAYAGGAGAGGWWVAWLDIGMAFRFTGASDQWLLTPLFSALDSCFHAALKWL